jgi:hypothetical protein
MSDAEECSPMESVALTVSGLQTIDEKRAPCVLSQINIEPVEVDRLTLNRCGIANCERQNFPR